MDTDNIFKVPLVVDKESRRITIKAPDKATVMGLHIINGAVWAEVVVEPEDEELYEGAEYEDYEVDDEDNIKPLDEIFKS